MVNSKVYDLSLQIIKLFIDIIYSLLPHYASCYFKIYSQRVCARDARENVKLIYLYMSLCELARMCVCVCVCVCV